MGFSKQKYWSGLPFPSPGDLPDPGIEPRSPMLQADSLPFEDQGSANSWLTQVCPQVKEEEQEGWADVCKAALKSLEVSAKLQESPGAKVGF